jgi:hypothetical protein
MTNMSENYETESGLEEDGGAADFSGKCELL